MRDNLTIYNKNLFNNMQQCTRRFPMIIYSTPLPYNTNSSHGNDSQKIKFLLICNIFESQELLHRWKGYSDLNHPVITVLV